MAITIPILTDFKGQGIDRAVAQFQKLEGAGQKAGFLVRKAALPAAAALGALGAGAIVAAKAAAEDAQAADKLAGTLKRVTGASDAAVVSTEDYISTLSQSVGVADDELRPALGKLATATKDLGKAQGLLSTALDISAQTGRPLESVTTGLAKAYGGNLGALKKLLPGFDEGIIKSKDFGAAQEELARLTGGAAAANAETAAGRFKKFQITLDETKESIGSALLPVFEAFLPILQSVGKFAQDNSKLIVILAGVFGGLATAIIAVNAALKVLGLVSLLTNPVGLAIAAVAALVAGIIILWKKSETFRDIVTGAWEAVLTVVQKVWDFFKGPLKAAFDVIEGVIKTVAALVRGDFSGVWDGLKQVVGGVLDYLKALFVDFPLKLAGALLNIGKAIVTDIVSGVVDLAGNIWNKISEMPGALLNKAAGWLQGLGNIGGKVIDWIVGGVSGLAQEIWDKISGFPTALWNKIKDIAGNIKEIGSGIADWIVNAFTEGLKGLGSAIKSAVLAPIRWLANKIVNNWPDIPGLPGPPGWLKSLQTVGLAEGGIVVKPTMALVGEAGPEAVVPLRRANEFGLGGGMTINVEAGLISTPDQIGQQIIEAIQKAQRRSGPVFAPA